jgi:hypothetical protein
MGIYVNTVNNDEWLKLTHQVPALNCRFIKGSNLIPLVEVLNGRCRALAVCYSEEELSHFMRPGDTRPKKYYLASLQLLEQTLYPEDYKTLMEYQ